MALNKQRLRILALLLLAAFTAYGLFELFRGDWRGAFAYWRGKGPILGCALLLQACDISFDCILWMWILSHLGIRPGKAKGALIFLAGYAGLLLPVQLGRFLRSEEISRLGMGPFGDAAKAELILLFLSGVGALAVLAGVITYVVFPLATPLAVLAVIATFLFAADRIFLLLAKTPVRLPPGYWWRKRTFAIALLAMVGWLLNGASLYFVVRDLPGDIRLWQTLVMAPSNMLLGASTGLPGGIGAVEGILGGALAWLEVPASHLALAVGAFRLVTFWLWIPVGWAAFTLVSRLPSKGDPPGEDNQGLSDGK